MKIKDIANSLQKWAPLSYQESYDNSGLILGDPEMEVKGITISLDVTEAVIDDAIKSGSNCIVAHHPLIFAGIKKITPSHWVNRCIIKAIKNDLAIYAIHTNLDSVKTGVNQKIAEKLGLENLNILQPKAGILSKLTVFVPIADTQSLLDGLYQVGAGEIGNYDRCSFSVSGKGTFRPGENASPTIGSAAFDETVEENRVEVTFPSHLRGNVLHSMKEAHPYDEVAYFLESLDNTNQEVGSGMIGMLPQPMDVATFLAHVKSSMDLQTIRYTSNNEHQIQKIALCGGSGSFLLSAAKGQNADAFITGDFKYHEFFEGEEKILIADIGHYESEVFTKDLILDFLQENFANIALRLTEVNTNPIKYL